MAYGYPGMYYPSPSVEQIAQQFQNAMGQYQNFQQGQMQQPKQKRNCTQATACSVRTRTRCSTVVHASATSGVFRLCGQVSCAPDNSLTAIS